MSFDDDQQQELFNVLTTLVSLQANAVIMILTASLLLDKMSMFLKSTSLPVSNQLFFTSIVTDVAPGALQQGAEGSLHVHAEGYPAQGSDIGEEDGHLCSVFSNVRVKPWKRKGILFSKLF